MTEMTQVQNNPHENRGKKVKSIIADTACYMELIYSSVSHIKHSQIQTDETWRQNNLQVHHKSQYLFFQNPRDLS